jgi:hypothetical protein
MRDDLGLLLAALRQADAIVLGSPVYVLGATSVVKTLQDRLLRLGQTGELRGRPALVMAAAGVPGWEPFALPQLSQLFLFLGLPIVDQFVGYAQGPGEILLACAALERARRGGAALARDEKEFRGTAGACPVCRFDLVRFAEDGRASCALCDLPGVLVRGPNGPVLEPLPGAEPRWAEAVLRRHFEEKIAPSRRRFKDRAGEIRERLRAFQEEERS